MQCFYPLAAWQTWEGDIHFYAKGTEGKVAKPRDYRRELILPCGQCIGCLVNRQRDWSLRLMHEASQHEAKCFVTLTYEEDKLPVQGQLVVSHFQNFMKRLRLRFVQPLRYYMCGEYGENFDRPHFHAILFGCDFRDDRVLLKRSSQGSLYTSSLLDRVWSYGFTSIGDVSIDSAAYVAGYVLKKQKGKNAEAHYTRVCGVTGEIYQKEPEFSTCSRDPAIGVGWLDKYENDVINAGGVIVPGGMNMGVPRAYTKVLEKRDGFQRDLLDITRLSRVRTIEPNDNSYERMRVKEEVLKAKLKTKCRNLE